MPRRAGHTATTTQLLHTCPSTHTHDTQLNRTCGHLYAVREEVLGVAGRAGVPLAEVLDVIQLSGRE
jgi:hypothetical protein